MKKLIFTPLAILYLIKGAADRSIANSVLLTCGFTEAEVSQILTKFYQTPPTHEGYSEFQHFVKFILPEEKKSKVKKLK